MRNTTRLKRLNMLKYMLDNYNTLFKSASKRKMKFDMYDWIDGCGTAACALGSACLYAPFNKLGLKLLYNRPEYNTCISYDAGTSFFNIPMEECELLFSPNSYIKSYHSDKLRYKGRTKTI